MISPSSTYRIQFNKDFNFKDFKENIPYLKDLGVDLVYASPIFEAVVGSTHGYDITNPLAINPEIGTEEELIEITKSLREIGIGWLQDIVPNHMAFTSTNMWLMDVLEKWDQSSYFNFFDINFINALPDKRLMVPFLGESLNEAIEQNRLKLLLRNGKLYLAYGEDNWPVNEGTYELVGANLKDWHKDNDRSKKLTQQLAAINGNVGLLRQVVDTQFYRLCSWQETEKQINYRRFFTVNGLICLNVQDESVFETYHQYILSLIGKGVFQGLRIDHIDGLFDPKQYLDRLRNAVGDEVYIIAEKILGSTETMPIDWPIEGSTGYDFLAIVNNVFTNKAAQKPFDKLYKEIIQKPLKVSEQVLVKKSDILHEHMGGELDNLYNLFLELKLATKKDLNSLPPGALKEAIANFLILCPIYRYYGNKFPLTESEVIALQKLFSELPKTEETIHAINLLTACLLDSNSKSKDYKERALYFYQRCMQFSGPLMAKGVEDTLMYTYNRFVGHTEVGDAPDAFGLRIPDFHEKMRARQENTPLTMNGTSTHDTKRGEDVRARLNVLTDIPERWRKLVFDLRDHNSTDGRLTMDLHQNDAYLIYQTVLGALPLQVEDEKDLSQRLEGYLEKALREAKKRSDWAEPNEGYELAAKNFSNSLLQENQHNYKELQKFLVEIGDYSIINSLSQLVLKCTCPGVPDIYQGTELWDLSLVDPDNRRAVDYKIRRQWLKELKTEVNLDELWEERSTGKVKLWLTSVLLNYRKEHKTLFAKGDYIPLKVKGKFKKHILAFLRKEKEQSILVVIPLGLAKLEGKSGEDPRKFDWKNTRIQQPADLPSQWENILTGTQGHKDFLKEDLWIDELFTEIPLAVLSFTMKNTERGSGILLHISSLPSKFGIGDLGPAAFKFVDFLIATKQKYWQLLPLNPTGSNTQYSPYSATSAMAGNVLLISPELLVEHQLLDKKELKAYHLPNKGKVEFDKVEDYKAKILHIAYKGFIAFPQSDLQVAYLEFCRTAQGWLKDYALFVALRAHHNGLPWNEWPEGYRTREAKLLSAFEKEFEAEIEELKWQQFIFNLQWHQIRDYANRFGILLIGDLPYYVGYDSADVWANPSYFKLTSNLEMEGVAGVPPDAFNATGQLWGMPIFDWNVLKKDNYGWWMKRIKKNIELFDYLRLDHFRAFDTYWEVSGTAEYATSGHWRRGPSKPFFNAVFKEFKELPFIVEDLGGEMMGTEELRATFNFPGMRVLQFGFGEDLAASPHLPHNYSSANTVVYIGTHDNNTCLGWFRAELSSRDKDRLKGYVGQEVTPANVNLILMKIALASSAKMAIFQLQDLLGLKEECRMNIPATTSNNWLWRVEGKFSSKRMKRWLRQQTLIFGRA